MVKISPACVGHNKNLSPLENILLLLFVEKVQRGARMSRLASKGFGEKKEIKVGLYVSHFYDMCNQCQTIWIQIRPNIFILPDLGPNCLKSRLRWYMFTSIVPDMGED